MLKNIFYILIFINSIELGISQTLSFEENQRNHRRYWYYRTRMINDFMKIGDGQGDCITFAQRNHTERGSNTGWVGPDQIDLVNEYLATLEEIENYYLKHGHLQNIPTEKEVKEHGVDLGEMNKLLLQKVEELTLYLVQQQKDIELLKAKVK